MAGPAQRVPFVGLTGGLGAGKSTALAALAELGAATLSTDEVVHELLDTSEVREAVAERLGPEVLRNGSVDRAAVAARVFDRPDDRDWLERLLWPRVGERLAAWRAEVESTDSNLQAAVVETPLLFEAGMESMYDRTIAVVAAEAIRAERAGARGHRGVEERKDRQLSQAEKSRRADFTVANDGTREHLKEALSRVLATIREEL